MSTNPTLLPTWLTTWEAFIKAHERMILITGAIAIIGFGVHKIDSRVHEYLDNKHTEAVAADNQKIAQDESKTQALETQIAQLQSNFQLLQQTDAATIATLQAALAEQKKKDDSMNPTELSQRWATLLKIGNAAFKPQQDSSIVVSNEAAHKTVDQLETIPELQSELTAKTTELTACTDLGVKKDADIAGLKQTVTDEKKGRQDDAKVAKDNERKAFWKGFKIGAVVGFIGGIAADLLLHKPPTSPTSVIVNPVK